MNAMHVICIKYISVSYVCVFMYTVGQKSI